MIGITQIPIPDRRFIEEAVAGAGFGFLAFARHVAPPREDQLFLGSVFDTIQDLCKNNDRIGQRRPRLSPPNATQQENQNA